MTNDGKCVVNKSIEGAMNGNMWLTFFFMYLVGLCGLNISVLRLTPFILSSIGTENVQKQEATTGV